MLGCTIAADLTAKEYREILPVLVQRGLLTETDLKNNWRLKPPTDAQLSYIRDRDGTINLQKLTRGQASDWIGKNIGKVMASKPCTQKQLDFIRELGGISEQGMNEHQACQFIEWLLENAEPGDCTRCPSSIYAPPMFAWLKKLFRSH